MRLFVAIDFPDLVHQQLQLIYGGIPGARWVEPAQLHLTLRFIGEVDGRLASDIKAVLNTVHVEPVTLVLAGIGHFPPRRNPEILWVGVEKNPALEEFQTKIESALARIGIARERHNFFPHVTIARLKHAPTGKIGAFMAAYNLTRTEPFLVDTFYLYSSTLGAKQAVHRKEQAYPLRTFE